MRAYCDCGSCGSAGVGTGAAGLDDWDGAVSGLSFGSLSWGRLLGALSTGAPSEAGVLSPAAAFAGAPTTADDG